MSSYPPQCACMPNALISFVESGSAFDDEGFEPGCILHSVNGYPLRDIIDWRWLTGSEDEILVEYTDTEGDSGELLVERDPGQPWGVDFEALLFDEIKMCRNSCTFCFMRQLPAGMRSALSVRDDDFRLSFLTGTFVTLTNLSEEDEMRIIEQNLSPLRFSLHAFNPAVRKELIGQHQERGMEAFYRLAQANIKFDVQIVLVPDVNDRTILDETLSWAARQEAIETVGVVPLGYTRFQDTFSKSFDEPQAARGVLEQIERFQSLRANTWVFAADEFYLNAYGQHAFEMIPSSNYYGDFTMFEDGVGMARAFIDDWLEAQESGLVMRVASKLVEREATANIVFGEAMRPLFEGLWAVETFGDRFTALFVRNDFFGGNVTVTGLLTAQDISRVLAQTPVQEICLVPRVVFNDAGQTLDDQSAAQLSASVGRTVHVVSCNPTQFLSELISIID